MHGNDTNGGSDAGESRAEGPDTEIPICEAVVERVADAETLEPADLEARLYDQVDPDALATLVETMDEGRVTFRMAGHHVQVTADGSVAVDGED